MSSGGAPCGRELAKLGGTVETSVGAGEMGVGPVDPLHAEAMTTRSMMATTTAASPGLASAQTEARPEPNSTLECRVRGVRRLGSVCFIPGKSDLSSDRVPPSESQIKALPLKTMIRPRSGTPGNDR